MLQQTYKYFWNFANNSLLIFTLTFFFTISTIQVQGAKEQFETTKPHVNTGNVDSKLSQISTQYKEMNRGMILIKLMRDYPAQRISEGIN